MRITINLDDDVVRSLKAYAKQHSITLGGAASGLLRRQLGIPAKTKMVNGISVFDLPPGSPRITTERVNQLLDEMDVEEALRFTPR